MEKVLIYQNRKSPAYVWNVSTPEKRAKAFLSLFNLLDTEWDCYVDLDINPTVEVKYEAELFRAAKAGNAKAAEELMSIRLDIEYEYWSISEVE